MRFRILVLIATAVVGFAAPSSAQSEGIKVRGRWTIEVRNADGTLASRTEFENALVANGRNTLVGFLAGGARPIESWEVRLNTLGGALCQPANPCRSIATTRTGDGVQAFSTLTLEVPFNFTAPVEQIVRLKGSVTATSTEANLSIGDVTSYTVVTDQKTGNMVAISFTHHVLAQPIPVASGQIIQFTVEIAFS